MEKLIELLNEYEKGDVWSYDEEMWMPYYWWGDDCDYDVYLISKKYWFIKRLVENEKIEWNNKDIAIREWILWKSIDNYHSLLMALAIQDEPLEFLVSILK